MANQFGPLATTARPPTERDLLFAVNGFPVALGVISATSGTPIDNAHAGTPFTLPGGAYVVVQALAGGTISFVSQALTAGGTIGIVLQQNQYFGFLVPISNANTATPLISWNPVSGTQSLNVFVVS